LNFYSFFVFFFGVFGDGESVFVDRVARLGVGEVGSRRWSGATGGDGGGATSGSRRGRRVGPTNRGIDRRRRRRSSELFEIFTNVLGNGTSVDRSVPVEEIFRDIQLVGKKRGRRRRRTTSSSSGSISSEARRRTRRRRRRPKRLVPIHVIDVGELGLEVGKVPKERPVDSERTRRKREATIPRLVVSPDVAGFPEVLREEAAKRVERVVQGVREPLLVLARPVGAPDRDGDEGDGAGGIREGVEVGRVAPHAAA